MPAPTITTDSALLADITARFDLRKPNANAVGAIVDHLANAEGFTESVADVATGVGKTYLMAALVEYLASQGVRNVLIVSPGSTIQSKTISNFTPGHPKYVPGAEYEPFIVTPENFRTGETGTVLTDSRRVKLFVFNVQQLIAPTQKASRKVREADENLGDSLYEHLRGAEDLVILSDEHHIYSEKAKAFSSAIRDLNPMALVGVTATPAESDISKVIFQYSLGDAIADEFVKVPVIVYRKDGHSDERTQLADACHLLRSKEVAYSQYRQHNPEKPATKPCLFVVCKTINHAQDVAALLTQPGMIGETGTVLEINATSSDEALQALADVEREDSPIRAIVSVDMLKEGWDVKRIAVIVALRRLASECLTEQILGRGLRLPFGARTGVPSVDQVDIVAHDSYQKLLAQKDVLLQRVDHSDPPLPKNSEAELPSATSETQSGASLPRGHYDNHPTLGFDTALDRDGESDVEEPQDNEGFPVSKGLKVVEMDDAVKEIERPPYVNRTEGSPQIVFPMMRAKLVPLTFSMSQVTSPNAKLAGVQFLKEVPSFLYRDALNASRSMTGQVEIKRTPEQGHEAFQQTTPIELVRHELRQALTALPEVQKEARERNAIKRVVDAFLEGAGVTADDSEAMWGEGRKTQAVEGLRALVRKELNNRKQQLTFELDQRILPTEPVPNVEASNAYNSEFKKFAAFTGWSRSILPSATFDAKSTEWVLAHMLDRDPNIKWWLRLSSTGPAYIPMENGTSYFPDFIAIDDEDNHWLIEGKSDKEAGSPDVVAKRNAAEDWARLVRDDGQFATWRYVFATESHLKSAGSWQALIYASAPEM
ncbi:hypothetical protein DQ353_19270 [Arthrobacter sp. AQ5-05]|uniref:DEAD/DEAH box helicase family protein n=1 Tax=Arthrobacter sp. AQ5-05 TaxID=2184581 RepID=UPI000DCD510E|nr:DEAD/DEAH box helicase family protein [Arthrobacter sp. AQ5-05]RAX47318.1 hypothetical protein DQ353_19270 [Arthrobacter sp. AQ5-05]